MTPDDVRNTAFTKPSFGRKGYDVDAVDAFLERVEQALRGTAPLTAEEVHNVAFGRARRGYNEDEVDAFLDLVQQELQRREASGSRPAGPQLAPPLEESRRRWWQGG